MIKTNPILKSVIIQPFTGFRRLVCPSCCRKYVIFSTTNGRDAQVLIPDWNGAPAGYPGGWSAYMDFLTNRIDIATNEEVLLYKWPQYSCLGSAHSIISFLPTEVREASNSGILNVEEFGPESLVLADVYLSRFTSTNDDGDTLLSAKKSSIRQVRHINKQENNSSKHWYILGE